MKLLTQTFILALLAIIPCLSFADTQVVTLKDGSQVKGELVGVNNGVYTIHTSAMGDVKVNAGNVANIANASAIPVAPTGTSPTPANSMDQKIQATQAKLMNDPQMMQQLQEMMQDPELMSLLSDPVLTQAVMSRDVRAVEGNPKAKQLMNNPKMRELMEKLK